MLNSNLCIEIDTAALMRNAELVSGLSDGADIMAVVKADAYGHGLEKVVSIISGNVSYYAVAVLEEALRIRDAGVGKPVIVLGATAECDINTAIERDITVSVSSVKAAYEMNSVAECAGKKIKAHLKVDTGMGRWGFVYKTAYTEISEICSRCRNIDFEGIFTHFPVADFKGFDYTERQIELFCELTEQLKAKGISFRYIHAANSAAIVNFPRSIFNMVRPGIMLYGYLPSRMVAGDFNLSPVMAVKSKVALIKRFPAGRGISYGRSYITPSDTYIAVVPAGYGCGIPYSMSGRGEVLIKGKKFPVAGNICMDYFMVDIGRNQEIAAGDEVVILGRSGDEIITAYDIAERSGTIVYEVLTRFSNFRDRVYLDG